jgi:hypothetical protein
MNERVPDASEKMFQEKVIKLAKAAGWLVFHTPPYSPRHGVWRSAGKGFPDLCLSHPKRGITLFAELKTEKGKLSVEQEDWGASLTLSGYEWCLWRPADWDNIVDLLWGKP